MNSVVSAWVEYDHGSYRREGKYLVFKSYDHRMILPRSFKYDMEDYIILSENGLPRGRVAVVGWDSKVIVSKIGENRMVTFKVGDEVTINPELLEWYRSYDGISLYNRPGGNLIEDNDKIRHMLYYSSMMLYSGLTGFVSRVNEGSCTINVGEGLWAVCVENKDLIFLNRPFNKKMIVEEVKGMINNTLSDEAVKQIADILKVKYE